MSRCNSGFWGCAESVVRLEGEEDVPEDCEELEEHNPVVERDHRQVDHLHKWPELEEAKNGAR